MRRFLANCRGYCVRSIKWAINAAGLIAVRPFVSAEFWLRSKRTPAVTKILYVCLAYRGDLLLNFPAIAALHRRFPEAAIDVWATPESRELAGLHLAVRNVLSLPEAPRTVRETIAAVLRSQRLADFAAQLRENAYDLAVDDTSTALSALTCWRAGIKRRIGNTTHGYGFLYHRAAHCRFNDELLSRRLKLIRACGLEAFNEEDFSANNLRSLEHHLDSATTIEPSLRALKEGYFTVQPYAGWQAKDWDDAALAETVTTFARRTGLTPVLIGSAADRARLSSLVEHLPLPVIDFVGNLSLAETLAIVAKARFHFGVDSVGGHMARLYEVPSVILFGPTNPLKIARLSSRHAAIRTNAPCTPAANKLYCCYLAGRACKNAAPLRELRPEQVVAIMLDVFGGSSLRTLYILPGESKSDSGTPER